MKDKIKVAIVGVGNCASALIQGIEYYRANPDAPGLITKEIDGYLVSDIEIVAAFDVDNSKVGQDISEAIFAGNNNVEKFFHVPVKNVNVSPAPLLDGYGDRYKEKVSETCEGTRKDVLKELKGSGAEMIVNYLPVGSSEATRWWTDLALETKTAFINCIPEFIASDPEYAEKFEKAGVPLIGDDIKSQFGATLLHQIIVKELEKKGVKLNKTYQLNFGGNMDFYNMLNFNRLRSKKISKHQAVNTLLKEPLDDHYMHIGPSDYVPWLEDNKWCYIHFHGVGFGGGTIRIEVKLEVPDSKNSAGVVVDVIRCIKASIRNENKHDFNEIADFYFKSPL